MPIGRQNPRTVIAITDRTADLGQRKVMEHRGIRYAVRIGIAREQWRVAIYPRRNGLPKEKTVLGTHKDAEATARAMINSWLRQQRSALRNAK
jgi:hypothetical protein